MEDPDVRRRMAGRGEPDDALTADALAVVRRLLAGQRYGVLATHDGRGAHATLVAIAPFDDDRAVLFATPRATRKFDNLASTAEVSLLVDDRGNDTVDLERAAAVAAVGPARELTGERRDRARAAYLARHPQLASFVDAPGSALLAIEVRRFDVVRRFQSVVVVEMAP